MSFNEMELDIQEIFNEVTANSPKEPNSYPLHFEMSSLKEIFEFLLQFVTMLCKEFYGDANGQVNLAQMTPEQFVFIDKYMQSIGFTCDFKAVPAIAQNINNTYDNRFDRITITSETKLSDLLFGIKCDNVLYVISFGAAAAAAF
jgi:hypothetical protein